MDDTPFRGATDTFLRGATAIRALDTRGGLAPPRQRLGVRKIWMVIPSFFPSIGGAETQARRLSVALLERGWKISVLTRRSRGRGADRASRHEKVEGIPVVRVNAGGYGKFASLQYLLGGLRILATQGRTGIYHAHDIGTPGVLAGMAARLFRGRSVVKLRTGAAIYQHRFGSGPKRWIFKILLSLHDRIIVVSSEVDELLTQLGIPRSQVIKIPNAIDGGRFRPSSPVEQREARITLGLPSDRKVVLFVGRLIPVKGVDVLLRAWALLPHSVRSDSMLVIVGDGTERQRLERLVRSHVVQDSVLMTGERPDVRGYYGAADLFVLPSRTEGFSNALIEAMASELPVIATDVGGTPDVVEDGMSGMLVPAGAEDRLAEALNSMLSRPEDWESMGARAREKAMEYAGSEVVLERLESMYIALSRD